jgi:hypothetical protein
MLSAPSTARDGQDAPTPKPDATYVSVEATDSGVYSRIELYGRHFLIRPVGKSPEVGRDTHDGGVYWVEEGDGFYHLDNIGNFIPKPGVTDWRMGALSCQGHQLSEDVHASTCKRMVRRAG